MKIAVTGRPGIGKTTLCMRVYETLKTVKSVSGFVTREVREGGKRVGFKLVNLEDGSEAWLARAEGVGCGDRAGGGGGVRGGGVRGWARVGKYIVDVEALEGFLPTINLNSELIIIDEVGPMELKSRRFVEFVENVMKKDSVLVTIHYRSKHWLVEKIRREFKLYVLDENNRDLLASKIAEELG